MDNFVRSYASVIDASHHPLTCVTPVIVLASPSRYFPCLLPDVLEAGHFSPNAYKGLRGRRDIIRARHLMTYLLNGTAVLESSAVAFETALHDERTRAIFSAFLSRAPGDGIKVARFVPFALKWVGSRSRELVSDAAVAKNCSPLDWPNLRSAPRFGIGLNDTTKLRRRKLNESGKAAPNQ